MANEEFSMTYLMTIHVWSEYHKYEVNISVGTYCGLVGYGIMYSGRWVPVFWRNILPSLPQTINCSGGDVYIVIKVTVFWHVTPCRWVNSTRTQIIQFKPYYLFFILARPQYQSYSSTGWNMAGRLWMINTREWTDTDSHYTCGHIKGRRTGR
jgi:hypothetical protein